ncbi:MAG: hypothetical protein WAZ98_04310 [Cyclobacteriaceae bacterium]
MRPRILMPFILSIVLLGCEDESELPSTENISIQFEEGQQAISEEDGSPITITLTLNKPSTTNGTVVLEIDETIQTRIQTTPAHVNGLLAIPFTKGASQLQLSVSAINNSLVDGDVIAKIRIKPSPLFNTGERAEFQLSLHDDDEAAPPSSIVNFAEQVETITENSTEAIAFTLQFSAPVTIDSKIMIAVESLNASAFVTNPFAEAGVITLSAPAGTTELSFTLNPLNNAEVTGHTAVTFSIQAVTGSLVKGSHGLRKLTIKDDELTGKLRGYENSGGNDSEKRLYEYDAKGRIAKVNWETYTGFTRTGTDTYFYDGQDRLIKINKFPGRDVHYIWNNGRIERAEVYQDAVLKEYATYAYDEAGNIAGVEPYHRQPDGSFKRGLFSVYLYFVDGNVYKAMLFQDVEGQEEPVLIRTRTYDQYLPNLATISMFEIIPGVKSQKNLAGRYREETTETDATYWLTYEFNADGSPVKRTASATGSTQTTVYHYY